MTGATPARRLLAQLIDGQALETEPIAEVRADLAALGIDPARLIALSHRVAANANSPAAALLRRISESEEDDDEIRRLEQMEIGAIRQSLPTGATAAAAARARRAAGADSNVVGLRRRRSRRLLYGLSGVAAAMAASLVFYVGLSTDQPFRFETSHQAALTPAASQPVAPPTEREAGESRLNQLQALESQPPSAEADSAKSELADTTQPQFSGGGIQAANEPAASGTQSAAQSAPSAVPTTGTDEIHPMLVAPRADQQPSADAADLQRQREKLTEEMEKSGGLGSLRAESPEPSNAPQPVDLASGATGATTTATPTTVPPLPTTEMTIIPERKPELGAPMDLTTAAADSAPAAEDEQTAKTARGLSVATAAPTESPAALLGLDDPVSALLIVNPRLVPGNLKQEDYPTANLPARLGEARRVAGGRSIVALATIREGDGRHDVALVLQPFVIDFNADAESIQNQLADAIRRKQAYQAIRLDER